MLFRSARVARPRGIISGEFDEVNQVTHSCAVGMLIYGFEAANQFSAERKPSLTDIFEEVEKVPRAKARRKKKSATTEDKEKDTSLINSIFISNVARFFTESNNEA